MTDDVKFAPPGLTFDDVLLLPAYSAVLPNEADTAARLSRNISLAHAARFLGHGHGHRGQDGGGDGAPGRCGGTAPQPVYRGAGGSRSTRSSGPRPG